jgi:hypothetical protein
MCRLLIGASMGVWRGSCVPFLLLGRADDMLIGGLSDATLY